LSSISCYFLNTFSFLNISPVLSDIFRSF
jgi:hypothetical protein